MYKKTLEKKGAGGINHWERGVSEKNHLCKGGTRCLLEKGCSRTCVSGARGKGEKEKGKGQGPEEEKSEFRKKDLGETSLVRSPGDGFARSVSPIRTRWGKMAMGRSRALRQLAQLLKRACRQSVGSRRGATVGKRSEEEEPES